MTAEEIEYYARGGTIKRLPPGPAVTMWWSRHSERRHHGMAQSEEEIAGLASVGHAMSREETDYSAERSRRGGVKARAAAKLQVGWREREAERLRKKGLGVERGLGVRG